jgi:hypothetical protein
MLCALLIFDGPEFPAPLSQLSPWLDQTIRPLDEVYAAYGAQQHRRFIKTHTPLDGLPLHDNVTYVVVERDLWVPNTRPCALTSGFVGAAVGDCRQWVGRLTAL